MTDLGISAEGVYVIAEVAQAHEGSVGMAHAYIDAIADAGANAVKFQTHIAGVESTRDEPWRIKFSQQDNDRYDYWKRMEFTPEQWAGLAEHARFRNIDFLSSPFSVKAVNLLLNIGIKQWKVASGELSNPMLLDAMYKTKLPIIFSSGMSTIVEIDKLIKTVQRLSIPYALLQCSSSYPTPPELWGLGVLNEYKKRYNCPVGISDHSGNIYAGLAATTLGAEIIEVHVTFDRAMFGPDVSSSIIFPELKQLISGANSIYKSLLHVESKDQLIVKAEELKKIFGRSLALTTPLPVGTKLTKEHLTLKKPATGIPYEQIDKVIGCTLKTDTAADYLLKWKNLQE